MKTIKYLSIGILAVLGLASCSDKFLEEKENFDNATQDLYNTYEGAKARVTDIYSWCLPAVGDLTTEGTYNYLTVSMGSADMAAKSTEEYSGFSVFVDPTIELSSSAANSNNSVPDFFLGQQANIQVSTYGRIRNINDAIDGISNSTLTAAQKDELLGQCYFFRAYCYYNLFKWYGGVPLVKELMEPVESAVVPRSSAKETMQFIVDDLNESARMLTAKTATKKGWESDEDYGRVTSGTALALKGRVLTMWCSPLFNRKGDEQRYKDAYNTMKEDLTTIHDKCGYDLFQSGSSINGAYYSAMFNTIKNNPEAIFFTLYNNIVSDEGLDTQKNNPWERSIRPSNTGATGKNASAMLVDMFPMSDGQIPEKAQEAVVINGVTYQPYHKLMPSGKSNSYNKNQPFIERDPRFYRTFALPGFRWAYSGTPKDANSPQDGSNYTLWNYVWYTKDKNATDVESGEHYGADNLMSSTQGVYVRKKSDDLDVNSPLYSYMATYSKGAAPFFSKAPLIDLRYAEVLLNLAEVACGANQLADAEGYLNQVRARAGVSTSGYYDGTQGGLMSAILYERQVEFAYEGKRFDDCRRWLLYDGGLNFASIPGCPNTWKLSGIWSNGTLDFLGVAPLNGQRRDNMIFRVNDSYGSNAEWTTWYSDPILVKDYMPGVARTKIAQAEGKAESEVTAEEIETYLSNADNKAGCVVEARAARDEKCSVSLNEELNFSSGKGKELSDFYRLKLIRKLRKGDAYDSNKNELFINFRPKYYFLGLSVGAQSANKTLLQTIGWEANYSSPTFDPLAE